MASLSFHIRKSDHPTSNGVFDLHVHVYLNEAKGRRPLGRYRLPTLEPVFPGEPELTQSQVQDLAGWLTKEEQIRKLNSCLKDTVFDSHKMAKISPQFGEIRAEAGETYINIRIPISKRIKG